MSPCAQELRGIAGRMVAGTLAQACDGEALVNDVLALHRLADAVEGMELALRPPTWRERQGTRASRKLARRLSGLLRRVLAPGAAGA